MYYVRGHKVFVISTGLLETKCDSAQEARELCRELNKDASYV